MAYAPLSSVQFSPGSAPDLWILGIALTGFSAIFTGVNLVTTTFYLRAPGMTMFRLPIFTWNMLVTAILILIAFPILTAAMVLLFADRHFGTHIYSTAGGGSPVLYQNLFWFFGHPEVYILALPYFGIVTDVIPVFSKKPLFGYKGMVFATMAIAALSTGVWAHHMFTTGVVLLPFFSLLSLLIAVPTGIKFFNWIGTMWRGQLTFTTPMLFCIGFLFAFLMGGLTGVMLASPPIDFATHDTYFVVAHFHQVLFGTAVYAGFAGLYYWYPKFFGRQYRESLGKWHFWLMTIGFWVTFIPQYVLGLWGMPRRVASYPADLGWQTLNVVSTIGAYVIGISFVFLLVNLWVSWRHAHPRRGQPVGRPHARVVRHLAARPPQLREAAADPLRTARVGLSPPRRADHHPWRQQRQQRPRPSQRVRCRGRGGRRRRREEVGSPTCASKHFSCSAWPPSSASSVSSTGSRPTSRAAS